MNYWEEMLGESNYEEDNPTKTCPACGGDSCELDEDICIDCRHDVLGKFENFFDSLSDSIEKLDYLGDEMGEWFTTLYTRYKHLHPGAVNWGNVPKTN